LLLKRAMTESPYPGIWQVVSGKKLAGEHAADTARREVREETGVEPIGLWALPFVNTFYAPGDDRIHAVPTFAAELAQDAGVQLSDEHSESRWVTRKDADAIVQWPAHSTMMDLVTAYVMSQRGSVLRIPHSKQ